MPVKDNIKRLRKEHDLTQQQLADALGVTRPTVTQWESGWSTPRMGMIEKLAEYFRVAKSEIVDDPGTEKRRPYGLPVYSSGEAYVPLVTLGKVHAGAFDEEERGPEQVEVPASVLGRHPNARAVVVEGDCMDRVVPGGMAVLYDPDREPSNGDVAIVETEDYEAMMRRWYRGGSTLMLVADSHADYEDIVLTEEDGPIRVLGTVVWAQSAGEWV